MEILSFLKSYLTNIKPLELESEDEFLNYRYLDSNHIDSFEIIQFIMVLEEEFDIKFDPQDTESDQFRYIGGLKEIIENKIQNKHTD